MQRTKTLTPKIFRLRRERMFGGNGGGETPKKESPSSVNPVHFPIEKKKSFTSKTQKKTPKIHPLFFDISGVIFLHKFVKSFGSKLQEKLQY